ncbi:hypothetical protein RRG08_040750 [Elysia crispata]|uniref:Uncharacterized protein n=1 Tax=Elysia crispata TaxID=231223 RepID=A0AAE1BDQ7_9GAST|nr:hypothetical protein RRG08_040750 [Elysia crispata]
MATLSTLHNISSKLRVRSQKLDIIRKRLHHCISHVDCQNQHNTAELDGRTETSMATRPCVVPRRLDPWVIVMVTFYLLRLLLFLYLCVYKGREKSIPFGTARLMQAPSCGAGTSEKRRPGNLSAGRRDLLQDPDGLMIRAERDGLIVQAVVTSDCKQTALGARQETLTRWKHMKTILLQDHRSRCLVILSMVTSCRAGPKLNTSQDCSMSNLSSFWERSAHVLTELLKTVRLQQTETSSQFYVPITNREVSLSDERQFNFPASRRRCGKHDPPSEASRALSADFLLPHQQGVPDWTRGIIAGIMVGGRGGDGTRVIVTCLDLFHLGVLPSPCSHVAAQTSEDASQGCRLSPLMEGYLIPWSAAIDRYASPHAARCQVLISAAMNTRNMH